MPENRNPDLTPKVSAETDVARLSHSSQPLAHQKTGAEGVNLADWDQIAAQPQFKALLAAKLKFIIPATLFFVVYYFALPVLVGWFPELMEKRIGPVNLAYLFALSQFFMAWILAYIYLRKAAQFDAQAHAIVSQLDQPKGGAK
ncbi:MAG: DUF485 domain-containing protein [Verrucomicrobia bacterium]|nr:DUF485 domain-containing protein [Verrucomicrobiota bacterium]